MGHDHDSTSSCILQSWARWVHTRRRRFELRLLEKRSKSDSSFSVDFDKHELVDKMVMEVGEMGERRVKFGEVSDGDWAFNTQAVGFDKHFGLFKPREEMVLITLELDLSKCSIT